MKASEILQLLPTQPLTADDEMWEELYAAYQRPMRSYHSFDHVLAVLENYRTVERELGWNQPQETFLAVLYHDAIYVCGRPDNEIRSAEVAREAIAKWLATADIDANRVARLIELTANHGRNKRSEVDADTALFLDCDIAILGAPTEKYEQFRKQVAAEYESVIPAELYRDGRRKFLGDVLAADRIFLSDYFESRIGAAARSNIRSELSALAD